MTDELEQRMVDVEAMALVLDNSVVTFGGIAQTGLGEKAARALRKLAREVSQPAQSAVSAEAEQAERRAERRTFARIANVARAIGWQAGVGARETAGAIVSYLVTSPDEIMPFVAGTLSPLDFAGDWMRGGCLSWHGADGKVWTPEAAAEAGAAKSASTTDEGEGG